MKDFWRKLATIILTIIVVLSALYWLAAVVLNSAVAWTGLAVGQSTLTTIGSIAQFASTVATTVSPYIVGVGINGAGLVGTVLSIGVPLALAFDASIAAEFTFHEKVTEHAREAVARQQRLDHAYAMSVSS